MHLVNEDQWLIGWYACRELLQSLAHHVRAGRVIFAYHLVGELLV